VTSDKNICLGVFAGAHGVKGAIKVKTFTTAPSDIAAYGPLAAEDGSRIFTLRIIRELSNNIVLVTAPEIAHREDAKSLSGVKLYIDRDMLPATDDEDEFYLEDLTGLKAIDETGAALGVVAAVQNYGAGDLLELRNIPNVKGARLIPFTKEAVPVVDISGGGITISAAFSPQNEENDPPPPSTPQK